MHAAPGTHRWTSHGSACCPHAPPLVAPGASISRGCHQMHRTPELATLLHLRPTGGHSPPCSV
eukprot:2484576-Lingulodinium_polyedra.AAC.1